MQWGENKTSNCLDANLSHSYSTTSSAEISDQCKSFSSSWSMKPGPSTHLNPRVRSRSLSFVNHDNCTPEELRRLRDRLLRTRPYIEPTTIRNFSRSQKITLASLALVHFMSFCSMSIMAPFFPREAAEKGLSETMVGIVFSFYALVMVVSSPVFGKILPQVGTRFLFFSGMFVAGTCNLLFGTLQYVNDYTQFTTLCLLIRGMEALGASAYSTASYIFVVKNFPDNISSVLGILETFVGLGMSTGPALGGFLYSLGGFQAPFLTLGVCLIAIIPMNICLLQPVEEYNITTKSGSIIKLLKVPSVLVTGLVVIVVSSTWGFLDPTLEPHLRQFDLSPEKVGLIFLLFSALYGISSPAWGWLSDKIERHWLMMACGLLSCTLGLLLLGPCPFLPFLPRTIWLNLLALSILGISVALALLPTFQGILTSALAGGLSDNLATYSLVAGMWSCMYSLGEVIGLSSGGFLLQHYGFPITATVMAAMTFILAVIIFVYFLINGSKCSDEANSSDSGIISSWRSSEDIIESDATNDEESPLLSQSMNAINHKIIW